MGALCVCKVLCSCQTPYILRNCSHFRWPLARVAGCKDLLRENPASELHQPAAVAAAATASGITTLRPRLPVTAIAATATTAAVCQGWRSSQFGAGAKPFAPGRLFQGGAGYWIGIRDAQCLWPPAGLAKVANRSPVLQCGGRRS